MIELKRDGLVFTFPKVHPRAKLRVELQRTLRIPDDGGSYPLPPGLGAFPLRHVDDFAQRAPRAWVEHGGVMMPMYQSEATWLKFDAGYIDGHDAAYPFAVKVATGKINAVTGDQWREKLARRPQDYLVAPTQPWLDGYCVDEGFIRQFVAMPLGSGYSAEEQITGEAEVGGLQVMVYPMKRKVFERRFPKQSRLMRSKMVMGIGMGMAAPCSAPAQYEECCEEMSADMGLAPGGRMEQEIYDDPFDLKDWDLDQGSRCFIHLCNSLTWRAITDQEPPTVPPTSREYEQHGLPWFEYYDDTSSAVPGSKVLAKLKSVATLGKEKGDVPLPENQSVSPDKIVQLRKGLKKGQVREGEL